MKYTWEDLEKDIVRQELELAVIRKDRGKRYGTPDDTLGNVAAFGWRGAVINAYECMSRLRNHFHQADPDPEDLRNAQKDLTNYAHYIGILFERETCSQEKEA